MHLLFQDKLLTAQVMPKGDLVLAKVAEAEEATTGGILLPSSAQRKPTSGKGLNCLNLLSCRTPPAMRQTNTEIFSLPIMLASHTSPGQSALCRCSALLATSHLWRLLLHRPLYQGADV